MTRTMKMTTWRNNNTKTSSNQYQHVVCSVVVLFCGILGLIQIVLSTQLVFLLEYGYGRTTTMMLCQQQDNPAAVLERRGLGHMDGAEEESGKREDTITQRQRRSSAAASPDPSISTSSTTTMTMTTHMIAVADGNFASKYRPYFDQMNAYAKRHGYSWHLLGNSIIIASSSSACHDEFRDFFFRKHCLVADWMEHSDQVMEGDLVYVFDSDVLPFRTSLPLARWSSSLRLNRLQQQEEYSADLVLYQRIWSQEIAAGNYIVKNNAVSRSFLRAWAAYEHQMPSGFSSADNGAIHLHLLRVLGYETTITSEQQQQQQQSNDGGRRAPPTTCGSLYQNLTEPVTNLQPYWQFVECCRRSIVVGTHHTDTTGMTVRLYGQGEGWVVDGVFDEFDQNDLQGGHRPVFHHGIKITSNMEKRVLEKYGLQNTSLAQDAVESVSCGGHFASTCSECPPQGNDTNGAAYCNGDCIWSNDECRPAATSARTTSVVKRTTTTTTKVSCGGHFATNCSQCPQGNGAAFCNGECIWSDNQCKPLGTIIDQ